MSIRICSRCKIVIRSEELFFCYNCGSELKKGRGNISKNAAEDGKGSSVYEKGNSADEQRQFFKRVFSGNVLVISLFLLGLVVLVSSFFVSVYFYNESISKISDERSREAEVGKIGSKIYFSFEDGSFALDSFARYVPSSIDIYLESINTKAFFEEFIKGKIINSDLEGFDEFMGDHMALFARFNGADAPLEISWGIILNTNRFEELSKALSDLNDNLPSGWVADVVSSKLVLTNDANLQGLIFDAKEELILNLSLTPGYVRAKNNVNRNGQIWVLKTGDRAEDILSNLFADNYIETNFQSYIISKEGVFSVL